MKNDLRFLVLLLSLLFSSLIFAQVPQLINYQAVARDATGTPLLSQPVSVDFAVRQGSSVGTIVYNETHSTTTNQFGLFAAEIGGGVPVSGTFSGINWSTGLYYLQVTVNGDVMPATQLLSVPYALHAETATSGAQGANGHNSLADSISEPAGANCPNGGYLINMGVDDNDDGSLQALEIDISYYICNGINGAANNNDTSAINELQTISISNDTLYLSNGGFAVLPSLGSDNDWSIAGNNMSSIPIGNVGIGTTIPVRKLSIESNATIGDGISINNSSTGHPGIQFQTQGNPRYVIGVDQSDNNKFKIGTTNIFTNTRFTITPFGRVGIGATAPSSLLEVSGKTTTDSLMVRAGAGTAGNVLTDDGSGNAVWQPLGSSSIWHLNGPDVYFNSGKVGVGILSPQANLHVNSNTLNTFSQYTNASTDSTTTDGFFVGVNNVDAYLNNTENGNLLFYTNNTERARLGNNGYFGIGTTTPSSQLEVSGLTTTDSLIVQLGAGTAGNVLTDDGTGKAVWQAPSVSSPWMQTGANIHQVSLTDFVGIGTTAPITNLHIEASTSPGMVIKEATPTSGSVFIMESLRQYMFHSNESGDFKLTDLTANSERMVLQPNGYFGFGASSPLVKMHVADNAQTTIAIQSSHNGAADGSSNLTFVRSRDSIAAPAAVQNGDRLGKIEWVGWNSVSFTEVASIRAVADENYGSTNTGTHLEFHTSPIGGGPSNEAVRISDRGHVGIGTTTPGSSLGIVYSGTNTEASTINYSNTSATSQGMGLLVNANNTGSNTIWAAGFQVNGSGNSSESVVINARNIASAGTNFGVRSEVNAAGTINFGIYSEVSGAATNWSAYFANGNVYVGDTLHIPTNAIKGAVLTSADAAGNAVWKPKAVAFESFISTAKTVPSGLFGAAGALVGFDQEIMDEGLAGGSFDPTNNTFRAPYDGVYSIEVGVVFEQVAAFPAEVRGELGLVRNGAVIKVVNVTFEQGPTADKRKSAVISATVRLQKNDILHIEAVTNGPQPGLQVVQGESAWFSGHLVYAD